MRTDERCIQRRRELLKAQCARRAALGMAAEMPPPPAVLVKAESVPVSPPEAPRAPTEKARVRAAQRVRTPGGGRPSMPASPHRPPTRKPPPPPPPTPPPNPPADASPRDILNRLRQQQPSAMDASAEGSLLRSSRESLPAGAVLGGRPARSAPLAPPAPSREEPSGGPEREEPPRSQASTPKSTHLRTRWTTATMTTLRRRRRRATSSRGRSEQPSASAEGSLLRRRREQEASSLVGREQPAADADAQVEQLADILDEDADADDQSDAAGRGRTGASGDRRATGRPIGGYTGRRMLRHGRLCAGEPAAVHGGACLADESKADDAVVATGERLSLYDQGGFDSYKT